MDKANLLTTTEAAEFLQLAPITLTKLRSLGKRPNSMPPVPFVRLGSRCVRYIREDLEAYARKHRVGGDHEAAQP